MLTYCINDSMRIFDAITVLLMGTQLYLCIFYLILVFVPLPTVLCVSVIMGEPGDAK